jgi:two-component system sensor histidine kinase YesM
MKRKFFLRNLFFIALPTVLVVALLGCMAIFMIYNITSKTINTVEEQTVSQIQDSAEVIFSEADAQSLNYSISPYILIKLESLLENGYSDKANMDISYMIKTYLDSNVNSKLFLHSIYIYLNNSHNNFFVSGLGLANQYNYSDVEWISQITQTQNEKMQWFEVRTISEYSMSSYSTEVLTLYKRLLRSGYSTSVGTIVLNIRMAYFRDFMAGYLTYDGQSILLMNENGTILCQAGTAVPFTSLEDKALVKDYFIATVKSPGYGLSFISLTPKNVVYDTAGDMIGIVWVFIGIAFIIGMILAFFITQKNARNVERVIHIFDSAEKGLVLPTVSEKTNDEYGFIIQNIVRNYVEKSNLQMQLAEKKHKLEAMYFSFLQSQLNPHFLFNTLKNIFWKTIKLTGGPNDTSRMIDLLTLLLHYALVNPDKFVKISDEIKITSYYLEILQMRFDNSFSVEWGYQTEVEEYRSIKFVLQSLVENSISHGLVQHDGSGKLRITIRVEEDRLHFNVIDNGSGFTPDRLEEINQRLLNEDSPVEGVGLYNLNKRLILTYGMDSGLTITSNPGVETSISFHIPLQK